MPTTNQIVMSLTVAEEIYVPALAITANTSSTTSYTADASSTATADATSSTASASAESTTSATANVTLASATADVENTEIP